MPAMPIRILLSSIAGATIGDPARARKSPGFAKTCPTFRKTCARFAHHNNNLPGEKDMSPRKSSKTVGVIGLGIMGGSFSRNLIKSGWRVVGFDTDPVKRKELFKAGVEIAKDAISVAAAASVIITSLPKPEALAATAKAIAAAGLPRKIVCECSTFTIEDKERAEKAFRAAEHVMLDCPVSGTGAQAAVGDLVIYASGDTKTVAKVKPLFAGFSRKMYDVGAFGNGSRMKYVANLLVAINNVASAEAMVLGMKSGLDPKVIFEMISNGAGNSRVFELRAPMMVKKDYSKATMKCSVWQKDMDVIGSFAKELRVPTPLFSATLPVYAAALKRGHGNDDTAAVCAVLEADARVKRRKPR
jgi:3-hydroxyisobutyrate dehydrogenase-like beta-hydroxyacid dehydrogenase